ncbi:MAG: PHP domain-containing protein [Clostridia bacterium]|nr:PHP domain-containing protein [Clostridia bacterium]
MRILSDLHTHTVFSHGKGTPEENVIAAIKSGLSRIAISEHGPGQLAYGVSFSRLLSLRHEIDRLNRVYQRDITVLMGLEANLTGSGFCDIPKDTSIFDMLAIGFHRTSMPRDIHGISMFFQGIGIGKDPKGNAQRMIRTMERFPFAFITHPGRYIKMDMGLLSKAAAKLNVALEINTSSLSMTDDEVLLAAKNGAFFVVNSDAHTPDRVGDFEAGLVLIKRLGISSLVINDSIAKHKFGELLSYRHSALFGKPK